MLLKALSINLLLLFLETYLRPCKIKQFWLLIFLKKLEFDLDFPHIFI